MLQPTLEEALRSPLIIVAEYIGPLPEQKMTYFSGARVQYKVVEVLKGTPPVSPLSVRYLFNDGSACLEPEGWTFEKERMPSRRSHWILFLTGTDESGEHQTYRGNFGRREATPAQVSEVKHRLQLP